MAGTKRNDWREKVSGAGEPVGLHPGAGAAPIADSGEGTDTDLRLAKIMRLQRAIAAGEYRIPAGAVAERIVEGLIRKSKSPSGVVRNV